MPHESKWHMLPFYPEHHFKKDLFIQIHGEFLQLCADAPNNLLASCLLYLIYFTARQRQGLRIKTSNEEFAKKFGVSVSSIKRALNYLKLKVYITMDVKHKHVKTSGRVFKVRYITYNYEFVNKLLTEESYAKL